MSFIPERAQFVIEDGTKIDVMFNPESYSVESSVNFAEVDAVHQGLGILMFKKVNPKTMSVDLYFDTLNGPPFSLSMDAISSKLSSKKKFDKAKDVTEYVTKFEKLIKWDSDRGSTPIVSFVWGAERFKGVVTKMSEKYTMFRVDGIPIRATLSISMTEYSLEMRSRAKGLDAVAKAASSMVASSAVKDAQEQQKEAVETVAKTITV